MRLDKLVSESLPCSRLEAKKIILSGRVLVNGEVCKKAANKITDDQEVIFTGTGIGTGSGSAGQNRQLSRKLYRQTARYIVINKPSGFICSTHDEAYPSALNLIDVINKSKLHFAGRLDQDTTGLVLISDDGQWTHRVTSPKYKQVKTYRILLDTPLTEQAIESLENGVLLKDSEKLTKPATVNILQPLEVELIITEGRYHQVKRMIAAVGSHVESLHRISVGHVTIAHDLEIGCWRYLTSSEKDLF